MAQIHPTTRPHSGPSRGRRLIPLVAASSFPTPPRTSRRRAKSISVGKGKSNDEGKVFPLAVKEGDRILFGKYSGTEIKLDGEDFIIMREEEVLGILSGAAKKELAGSRR